MLIARFGSGNSLMRRRWATERQLVAAIGLESSPIRIATSSSRHWRYALVTAWLLEVHKARGCDLEGLIIDGFMNTFGWFYDQTRSKKPCSIN